MRPGLIPLKAMNKFLLIATGLCAALEPSLAAADELRFDSARDWRQWVLPGDAVEVSPTGVVRPVAVRRHINASLNARDFGGGIRGVGSNERLAVRVLDGDPATGWRPDLGAPAKDWWIEIDLGRAVSAERVELLFAEEAPPFELFELFISNGEQMRDETRSYIEESLVYPPPTRYVENDHHRIVFEFEQPRASIVKNVRVRVLHAVPEALLTEIAVKAFGDNLALGVLDRGGDLDIAIEVENASTSSAGKIRAAIDGLMTTKWYPAGGVQFHAEDTFAHLTLDLGATYWVDRVRIVGGSFGDYKMGTSDGSLAPDGSLDWLQHYAGFQQTNPTDHLFASVPTRYLQVRWKFWDGNCPVVGYDIYRLCIFWGHTVEFQVFGEGYPHEVRLSSTVLDLGAERNINALHWDAQTPPGARLELRSRSGNALDSRITFYDKDYKEVTERRWNKLIPSFRGPIDTTIIAGADWSPWSRMYERTGDAFQSPSLRRYVELEALLVSEDPQQAVALDWLSLDFSDPLAQEVMGEIFPVEVVPGVEREFSYFVRAPTTTGFDRLVLAASTPMRFVEARVADEEVETEVEEIAQGFRVQFSQQVRSRQLVELRFAAAVFVQATRFDAFLEDSRTKEGVRQHVEAGNANVLVESSTTTVRLPLSAGLFSNFSLNARTITPNGDGVNDQLAARLTLVNVLERRPLRLSVYNLAGRLVQTVSSEVVAGPQELVWDGRGRSGRLVPPGTYVVSLEATGDAQAQRVNRVVVVVY